MKYIDVVSKEPKTPVEQMFLSAAQAPTAERFGSFFVFKALDFDNEGKQAIFDCLGLQKGITFAQFNLALQQYWHLQEQTRADREQYLSEMAA